METNIRPYTGDEDFLKIRDFFVDTYSLYQRPYNWLIDRWNFSRRFGLPYHTHHSTSYFGVPAHPRRSHRDEHQMWENAIGIWDDQDGNILGVVHTENEEPGEAWIQIHPEHTRLYAEMITYIEERLADRAGDTAYVKLYVTDDSELGQIARDRGYRKIEGTQTYMEYVNEKPVAPVLPDGFVVGSVEDVDDVEKRRMVRAFSFGAYCGPSDWPPASVFTEMQQAPDYRRDLDLFIVAPNGDYASFCTIWLDDKNGYANFEPVGTHADYQRRGLARALLREGFRRMAAYGATKSYMPSGNEFYRKVGFRPTSYSYSPWIRYFKV